MPTATSWPMRARVKHPRVRTDNADEGVVNADRPDLRLALASKHNVILAAAIVPVHHEARII
jgi:hypothetical protein